MANTASSLQGTERGPSSCSSFSVGAAEKPATATLTRPSVTIEVFSYVPEAEGDVATNRGLRGSSSSSNSSSNRRLSSSNNSWSSTRRSKAATEHLMAALSHLQQQQQQQGGQQGEQQTPSTDRGTSQKKPLSSKLTARITRSYVQSRDWASSTAHSLKSSSKHVLTCCFQPPESMVQLECCFDNTTESACAHEAHVVAAVTDDCQQDSKHLKAAATAPDDAAKQSISNGTTAATSDSTPTHQHSAVEEELPPCRPLTPGIAEVQLPAAITHTADATSEQQLPAAAAAPQWSFGSCAIQNGRSHMEDRHIAVDLTGSSAFAHTTRAGLFGVFDGHGGDAAAEHLANNILPLLLQQDAELLRIHPLAALATAVSSAEASLLSSWTPGQSASGSTLCMALLLDDTLHVVNVGDSRAVLARGPKAVTLTTDHKPSSESEQQRILAADPAATISSDGYLYGELGVSRGLGSAHIKADASKPAYVATPELVSIDLLSTTDDFLIIGTDGLWDKAGSNDAAATARRVLATEEKSGAAGAAQALVERAVKLGSQDNTSVVLVLLHGRGIVLPKSNSRLFSKRSIVAPATVSAETAEPAEPAGGVGGDSNSSSSVEA